MLRVLIYLVFGICLTGAGQAGEWQEVKGGLKTYVHVQGKPDKILFYLHGDGWSETNIASDCDRFRQMAYINNVVMACSFRHFKDDSARRRSTEEIDLFVKTVIEVQSAYEDLPTHCAGHSSGGHLCVSASQRSEAVSFGCVAAASAPLSTKVRSMVQYGEMRAYTKNEWDPVEHLSELAVEKLLIIGAPGDEQVAAAAWTDFYDKAKAAGLPVEFKEVWAKKTEGQRHDTRFFIRQPIEACMNAYRDGSLADKQFFK